MVSKLKADNLLPAGKRRVESVSRGAAALELVFEAEAAGRRVGRRRAPGRRCRGAVVQIGRPLDDHRLVDPLQDLAVDDQRTVRIPAAHRRFPN